MRNKQPAHVRLYRVPLNHRGATREILSEAIRTRKTPDFSDILYIAPTPRKLRDAQKIFHTLVSSPYVPPQFFTLKQFAKMLFERDLPGKVLPQPVIPLLLSEISGHSIGYASVLSDVLKELKQHHPSKDVSVIRQELTRIFTSRGIPEDALARIAAALTVFSEYGEILADLGYYDEDDILVYGKTAVERLNETFSVLIIDGFYQMTSAEMNIVKELINTSGKVFISIPFEKSLSFLTDELTGQIQSICSVEEVNLRPNSAPDLAYIAYNSSEDEIEGIARHIKNLFVSGRLTADDWIVVTLPGMAGSVDLMERVFRRYGLPYTISLQQPALRRRPFCDILMLLDAVADDFPRAAFTSVLTSFHFTHIPDILKSRIPSLSISSGLVKGKDSWLSLDSLVGDAALSDEIRTALTGIFDILERLIALKDASQIDDLHAEIEKVVAELGLEAENDDRIKLRSMMEVVRTVSQITGNETLSLKRYTEFLRHVLGSTEYRQEEEGIQIMDFLETRGLEPDYLYFCGLKDGDLPSKPPIDHILPDTVRTDYGLVNLNTYLSTQKLNFLRLIGGASHSHLSYAAAEGDKLFLPSPYLPVGGDKPETTCGIFSEEERLTQKGKRVFADSIREIHLDRKVIAKLLKKELSMPLRVTDIDQYRKCPRRYFLERILKLEAHEIPEYEIEAKTLGTIVHSIMEHLIKEPPGDPAVLRERIAPLIDNITAEFPIADYLRDLLRESFLEILPDIMEIESGLREEGFRPHELEMKITAEVLPGIILKGKIDRIDRRNGLVRIMDYKTGAVTMGSGIIRKGSELQLPLYAAMLKSQGITPEKAGVYSLKDLSIQWIPTKKDRNTLDDYIISSLKYLEETVYELQKGTFAARPLDEYYCFSCNEAPFCPYIHSRDGDTQ